MSDVLCEIEGSVATVRLNRPSSLNSFTTAMLDSLRQVLDGLAADRSVRVVVLTGEGRAFCAGQDLSDAAISAPKGDADVGDLLRNHYVPLIARLRTMPVPVLCAVNGVAAGAGANIALACDVVFATERASFFQAFAKIGLVPDAGGTYLLPRLVGRARALGLAMLAERIPAKEAEAMGLIWKCVADDAFEATVQAAAKELASLPTNALVAIRSALDYGARVSVEEALENEATLQAKLGRSEDFKEGVAAFREKRAAQFTERSQG